MIKIAIPNKGSLSEVASQILKEAGYAGRRDSKALNVYDKKTMSSSSSSPKRHCYLCRVRKIGLGHYWS